MIFVECDSGKRLSSGSGLSATLQADSLTTSLPSTSTALAADGPRRITTVTYGAGNISPYYKFCYWLLFIHFSLMLGSDFFV